MQRPLTLDRAAGFTWRALLVGFGVVVATIVLSRLRLVVLPAIIAGLLTTVLMPVVDLLARRLPRMLAVWAVILLGVGAFVGVGYLVAPSIASQFSDLGVTLEDGREQVEDFVDDGPFGLDRAQVDEYVERVGEQFGGQGSDIASGVLAGAVIVFEVIASLLLIVVLLFFFLKDGDRFAAFGLRSLRPEHHDLASALGQRAWAAAGGYVRGTALVALVDAVIIGVGLAVIGVPLVVPLAILTFLGAFFPLVGATLAGVVAALVALVDGGLDQALLVTGLIIIVQQVEGDVLAPLVLGRAVKLHPIVILVVLTAGAVVGGLLGAFLAVPVTAVAVAVGSELRARGILGPDPVDQSAVDEREPRTGPT